MQNHFQYIKSLIDRGGPALDDYPGLDSWITDVYRDHDDGGVAQNDIEEIRHTFGDILTPDTMHGMAYCKPHGYAGDYEIIDRHYTNYTASHPHLASWDRYWQAGPAAKAVRNRKDYFHGLLIRQSHLAGGRPLQVLNIASGPGRDVLECFTRHSISANFLCIDQDPHAVAYAQHLCSEFSDRISFLRANVLRFTPSQAYDVIWAAGLFDYFSDRIFKAIVRRLLPFISPGGQLVIGNFSEQNPNFNWLRFCKWDLNHRSPEQLMKLAVEAGAAPEDIEVGFESEGVNLFLHIHRRGVRKPN